MLPEDTLRDDMLRDDILRDDILRDDILRDDMLRDELRLLPCDEPMEESKLVFAKFATISDALSTAPCTCRAPLPNTVDIFLVFAICDCPTCISRRPSIATNSGLHKYSLIAFAVPKKPNFAMHRCNCKFASTNRYDSSETACFPFRFRSEKKSDVRNMRS